MAAGRRIAVVLPQLSERGQRLLLGAEARELGYGGVSAVAAVSNVARSTVQRGRDEIEQPLDLPLERSRRAGAGRKPAATKDPGLVRALESLVDPATRGDPESPLRWTSKSTRQLADALGEAGHPVGERTTAALLRQQGYSLQANAKTREGRQHPDRDAQFRYINEQVRRFLKAKDPVISVDTKKKELVGADSAFKNAGREWEPKGRPVEVGVHDFPDPQVPKAIPYGVYDLAANAGWVAVGSDGDTAEFAAETLRRWWTGVGRARYRSARRLLVCADAGGSNGYRVRLWKVELAKLAERAGLAITVCHFPPGTSKWNKIEHRLFAHISMNWRGRPLVSHEVVVELIGATTTRT
ncbi:MAG: ISAzo13 family transposase, partial [Actinobacteria bacterium]|nr:ISAzo13 family transposase [Actinomycetota bacterium]